MSGASRPTSPSPTSPASGQARPSTATATIPGAAADEKSAERRVGIDLALSEAADGFALTLTDEEGISAAARLAIAKSPATNPEKTEATLRENLAKLGTTQFAARRIDLALSQPWFIPASAINGLRRDAVTALEAARRNLPAPAPFKAPVEPPAPYPRNRSPTFANIYNDKARAFYAKHGVKLMDAAFEAHEEDGEVSLMVTKHRLRFVQPLP